VWVLPHRHGRGTVVGGWDPETHTWPKLLDITFQIDDGPAQPLAHTSTRSGPALTVMYQQFIGALADGKHKISVTADFSFNTDESSVTLTVGAPPTISNLTATCTAKSAFTLSSLETIVLSFSPPSVVIQSFPTIIFPTASFAGASLDVTMSLNNPGPGGNFEAASGIITIPGVVFNIDATISIPTPFGTQTRSASGTLTTTLTTEGTGTLDFPTVFSDNGERLQAGGQVLLVGDGLYSTPIFGMTDGGISLTGFISPHP
jgi:hypothetical protein